VKYRKRVCTFALIFVFIIVFPGCGLKKAAKLLSGIKVNKHSAEEYPESYMGPEVL